MEEFTKNAVPVILIAGHLAEMALGGGGPINTEHEAAPTPATIVVAQPGEVASHAQWQTMRQKLADIGLVGADILPATKGVIPQPSNTCQEYQVTAADTAGLSGVIKKTHWPETWQELAATNDIPAPYIIRPGETLYYDCPQLQVATPENQPSPQELPLLPYLAVLAVVGGGISWAGKKWGWFK